MSGGENVTLSHAGGPAPASGGGTTLSHPGVAGAPSGARAWAPGELIGGLYEVRGILGEGGMGTVYRVRHAIWGADLAVKTPIAERMADPRARESFLREAEAWVALGVHPHIAQCYYVRDIDGLPRIFVEWVGGGTLKEWMRGGRVAPGAWPAILDLAIQACDGLAHAHAAGLVHRDVKPANLLMTEAGELKVTDFGLVKPAGGGGARGEAAGGGVGTPEYAAPEQWRDAAGVDARADIYGLGVSLFEMCCGRRPFDDAEHAREPAQVIINRHLFQPPPDPASLRNDIPAPIRDLVLRMLDKDPARRPATIADVRAALVAAVAAATGKPSTRAAARAADLRAAALVNRGASLLDLGRADDARAAWEQALRLEPNHPEATFNAATDAWRRGEISDTDVVARLEGARVADHTGRAAYLLGLAHLARGDAEGAIEALKEARKVLGASADVLVALGDAFLARKGYEDSKAAEDAYHEAGAHGGDATLIAGRVALARRNEGLPLLDAPGSAAVAAAGTVAPRCRRTFEVNEIVRCLEVAPDGLRAVVGTTGKNFILRFAGGRRVELIGHSWPASAAAIAPRGPVAATGDDHGGLAIWHLVGESCMRSVKGVRGDPGVIAIRFLPEGGRIAVQLSDGTLAIRTTADPSKRQPVPLQEKPGGRIAVAPDGTLLVPGDDGRLRCIEVPSGRVVRTVLDVFTDLPRGERAFEIELSASGRRFIAHAKRKARVLDLETGSRIWERDGCEGTIAIDAAGNRVLVSVNGRLVLDDLDRSGEGLVLRGHAADPFLHCFGPARFFPEGRRAVSAGVDYTAWLWDLGGPPSIYERPVLARPEAATLLLEREEAFARHLETARGALSRKDAPGALAALAAAREVPGFVRDPRARDLASTVASTFGLQRRALRGAFRISTLDDAEHVQAIAMAPDGCVALGFLLDGRVELRRIATGERLEDRGAAAPALARTRLEASGTSAVLPDGRRVFRPGLRGDAVRGREAEALEIADGVEESVVARLDGHTDRVTSVALAADGRLGISASRDGTVALWELATGRRLRSIDVAEGWVTALAVTPDGRHAAAASRGALRVLDLVSGACLATLGTPEQIDQLGFSSDARFVVARGRRVRAYELEWELDPERRAEGPSEAYGLAALPTLEAALAASTVRGRMRGITGARVGPVLPQERSRDVAPAVEEGLTIMGLAVSAGGKRGLTATHAGTLRLYDLERGKQLRSWQAKAGSVFSLAMTPDGRLATTACGRGGVLVWDLESQGPPVQLPTSSDESTVAVALAPDGKHVVSAAVRPRSLPAGSKDGRISVWSIEHRSCVGSMDDYGRDIYSLALSADGKRCLAGCADGTMRLWDLERRECVGTTRVGTDPVLHVSFAAGGRLALTSGGALRLWDLETGCALVDAGGVRGPAVLLPDQLAALTVGGAKAPGLHAIDLATGGALKRLDRDDAADPQRKFVSVAVSADGRTALTADEGSSLRVVQIDWAPDPAGRTLADVHLPAEALARVLRPDPPPPTVAEVPIRFVSSRDVCVLAVRQTDELRRAPQLPAAVFPDGEGALVPEKDGALSVVELKTGGPRYKTLRGHRAPVHTIAFSPGGSYVASASSEDACVWDLASGRCVAALPPACDVAFGPDARWVVVATMETLEGRELRGESARRSWSVDVRKKGFLETSGLAIVPGGRFCLRLASDDVSLFELETGRKIFTRRHGGRFAQIACPDACTYVTAGEGGMAVYELATGRQIKALAGESVTALALLPGGALALAGVKHEDEGLIGVVDLASLDLVDVVGAHEGGVAALSTSVDGRTLVSTGIDDCVTAREIEWARLRAGDPPSLGEVFGLDPAAHIVESGVKGALRRWFGPGGPSVTAFTSTAAPRPTGHADVARVSPILAGASRSLAEAVRTAPEGARVLVFPGTYRETVTVDRKVEIEGVGSRGSIVIEGAAAPAVVARAAQASLRGVTIRASGDAAEGAVVIESGRILLEGCDVGGGKGPGIVVRGAGSAPAIRHCRVRDGAAAGVIFRDGAAGVLDRCDISGHASAQVEVGGGARVAMRRCKVREGKHAGVSLVEGGRAEIDHCELYKQPLMAISVGSSCSATIAGCTIKDTEHTGIYVEPQGAAIVEDCDVSGTLFAGVYVRGTGELRRCKLHDGRKGGVRFDKAARGAIEDCEIAANAASQVDICEDAAVGVRRCRVHRGGESGLLITTGGPVIVEDCDIAENAHAALQVSHRRGDVVIRRCRIHHGRDNGVAVAFDGVATVEASEVFENALAGVVAFKGGRVTIRDCRFRGGAKSAVMADGSEGAAHVTVEDCEISGLQQAGVGAGGPGGEAVARRCRITDCGVAAATVGPATMTVEDCDLRGNARGAFELSPESQCRRARNTE